jgi:hypothetical protein
VSVSFDVTKIESELIAKIALRASEELRLGRVIDVEMDITACHANGCTLDLRGLLASDPLNFAHDLRGIDKFINRRTGKIQDSFRPRFSAPMENDQ